MKRPDILDYKDRNDYFDDLERYIDFLEKKTGGGAEGQLETDVISDIDVAKEFLIQYMCENFKDKCFTRYIKERLAGDFAVELANAIRTKR